MVEYKQPQTVSTPTITSRTTANDVNMSVGNISRTAPAAATNAGIKIRGTGAAIKGTTARGPMA